MLKQLAQSDKLNTKVRRFYQIQGPTAKSRLGRTKAPHEFLHVKISVKKDLDLFQWWQCHQSDFPLQAKLYCIPASSASSELYSSASNTHPQLSEDMNPIHCSSPFTAWTRPSAAGLAGFWQGCWRLVFGLGQR